MQTILTVTLALLALLTVSLQRTYSRVPIKELKRDARQGDKLATAMLKAVGYGHSLRAVLWFLIGVTSAGFFVVVTRTAPLWFALTASIILVWVGFVFIPAARVSLVGRRLAGWCAPLLAKVVGVLHPLIDWTVRFIHRHRPIQVHTGLYDRRDLVDLLERQQVQPDNRIEKTELEIALHALQFGDETIAQHMVPRRAVKVVSATEPLGPILMDELYASGHSRFPVYENKRDNIIGTLYLRDLVHAKHSGSVQSLMKPEVSYIHEDQSLQDALQAILRTHRQLFVVVNSFEEYVGTITIEDVLEAIIGSPIIDEFDQYDDLRAVASRAATKEHTEHHDQEAPVSIPEEHIDETVEM
ncbi:MAG TPA: CBS domain-containing protein [Candidatus Saccharimonadales bacterium]|nr:CBS domain-containing protein [Candidatus Saccharimonadales bacterium]